MNLEIITPGEKLFEGKVKLVKVPGTKGSFAVLRNHAPIISTLQQGSIKIIDQDNKTSYVDIKGGIIEVNNDKIVVLADII